jgi:plasmid stability protein
MPAVLIRGLSEATHRAIKQRAKQHGKSVAAEVRAILEEAVVPTEKVGLGTRLHQIFRDAGVSLPEIVRDKSPSEPANFD